MMPVLDSDGLVKPAIQLIVEEAVESGIERVCIVTQRGDATFEDYFSPLSDEMENTLREREWALEASSKIEILGEKIDFVIQHKQEGYGDAVLCAREWVGDEPFLLLLGDHLYRSIKETRCAKQLIDVHQRCRKSVSAVVRTPEDRLRLYGTVAGERVGREPVYRLREIVEKPDVNYARTHLRVEGLPEGEYLCFFGMHVLTPGIFSCISYHKENKIYLRGEIQLTDAQEMLRAREGHYAFEVEGRTYDFGNPEGVAETIVAFNKRWRERNRL